ncbi:MULTISPECIES: hypothetical protein [unclassified Variovorax]|jgi:hypothetical protein|uniref:hypothetical protein n=1 Tax=unclassified Variovorax TaxID=663243 RepID=UPI000F7ECBE1|nr:MULTISPECIES: hypothetical protein [unclassified Variovorax]RSZ30626.1 hypothetical protein EJO70_32260 [Variovorax sp. 553]RSZ31264.1 hypothetical protein EJO71_32505 [Variovorax sp. 679]
MTFDFLFRPNHTAYLRRAAALLEEAQMARIEHQAAAEHHSALARMYAERVRRLENELYRQPQGAAAHGLVAEGAADDRPQLYSLDGSRKPGLTSAS